jgi:hypothetical protein
VGGRNHRIENLSWVRQTLDLAARRESQFGIRSARRERSAEGIAVGECPRLRHSHRYHRHDCSAVIAKRSDDEIAAGIHALGKCISGIAIGVGVN